MKRIDPKSVIIGLLSGVCIMLLMGQAKPNMSGVHDSITTKNLNIVNDKGDVVGGFSSGVDDGGYFTILDSKGKHVVSAMSAESAKTPSHGIIFLECGGKTRLMLSGAGDDNHGGYVHLYNKTDESVVQLGVDEYGNGVVGAFNRKGKGRTLQPGP